MVAIDIETTGLDSNRDAIIEIAAVRFNGARIEEEWSTLVNPNRPIPPEISHLTGITNDMVRNAPPVRAVVQDLADFVGAAPVLGQNVRFDLGFLQKLNILQLNEVVDTYQMAAVLMPTSSRYNLGTLGANLGILIPNSHRALDDARLTHAVYVRLVEMAEALPIELLAEIVRLGEPLEWDGFWGFREALKTRVKQPITARQLRNQDYTTLFGEALQLYPPLTLPEEPKPLNTDEVAAILEHGGPFSDYFSGYEYRPQQVEMLRAVADALSNGNHLMVEAGTGTGKSYAYLIPAAYWALTNNTRVVISTNTITLQDQLINKDIPDLKAALGLDLRTAVLKGRANYLCPRRLEAMRQRTPENADEMRVLGKVLVWIHRGGSGDRGEINLNGPIERDIWNRLSADDEGCKAEVCISRMGGACPFQRAKTAAQSAHLLIVNHALLLSDVVTGSRVLPEYNYLIVDEGHHLEAATTSALSYRVTQPDLGRLLKELGGLSSGVLSRLYTILVKLLKPSEAAGYHQAIQRATDLAFRLDYDFGEFFRALDHFLEDAREGYPVGTYGQQTRITPATRTLPAWEDVEIAWDSCRETLALLTGLLQEILKSASEHAEDAPDELEDSLGALGTLLRRLMETEANLTALVSQGNENYVYWAEIGPNGGKIALQIAPIHIGPLMEQHLWHQKASVIVTSATLTANGEFDYLKNRLNADEAEELILGSPFDYESSALLYLVDDIPEPNDGSYQRLLEGTLTRLAQATNGRMLVLFTSYAQLKKTSRAIGPELSKHGIEVYEQGEGSSTNTLLETFREADKAVLLGTRAFWEGVDIPGEALSVLVITKLPFDVPSDPIIAARAETFEDPFNEYSLPEAILRFRQGFGRLIRTQSDRGIVVVLDRRLLNKKFGRLFLDSLPECTKRQGKMLDLPAAAARWLNL